LSDKASRELAAPETLRAFRAWLRQHRCYIFTINGFPYGRFHGGRVKEQVAQPDWTFPERLDYTKRLFDILAALLQDEPRGIDGSVSTVPVSFKQFRLTERQVRVAREHLWQCVEHLEHLSRIHGRRFHLGLEPEPLGFVENTPECVEFFAELQDDRPGDMRLREHLGINYDACHLAIQFEQPQEAFARFRKAGIKISKIHLSNALSVRPTAEVREALKPFLDEVYFHQVLERRADGEIVRYRDLDEALATSINDGPQFEREWRIHFHIPLHAEPTSIFGTTAPHLLGVLDEIQRNPSMCSHFEMETYTWEVMPPELKQRSVVQQLADEYAWTLKELGLRGFTKSS
jgi:sugar phosphate isomerase/epimerase